MPTIQTKSACPSKPSSACITHLRTGPACTATLRTQAHEGMSAQWEDAIYITNITVTALYTVEMLMRCASDRVWALIKE